MATTTKVQNIGVNVNQGIAKRQYDVGEILTLLSECENAVNREKMLSMCSNNNGVKNALMAVFNPEVKFKSQVIPEWQPCDQPIGFTPARLETESVKMVRFLEGHHPEITGNLYDKLLGDLMSNVHPNEAMVIQSMIRKESLGHNITEALVRTVFPDLLPPKVKKPPAPRKKRASRSKAAVAARAAAAEISAEQAEVAAQG